MNTERRTRRETKEEDKTEKQNKKIKHKTWIPEIQSTKKVKAGREWWTGKPVENKGRTHTTKQQNEPKKKKILSKEQSRTKKWQNPKKTERGI